MDLNKTWKNEVDKNAKSLFFFYYFAFNFYIVSNLIFINN
jgi:hypothetical protein